MEPTALTVLEQTLQYEFKNKGLLEESLRHSSFVNEQGQAVMRDNERLEFLGDAVLNLIVGHLLMSNFPDLHEGDLSRFRSHLVNEAQLAKVARKISLGSYITLGKGELQSDGQNKQSILADAFEALIAAIYLDGGFDAAFRIIQSRFLEQIRSNGIVLINHDYKSQLQEFIQTTHTSLPAYTVVSENGPDHDKTFRVQLKIDNFLAEGVGKSKKIAEQEAAGRALEMLRKEP